MNFLLNGIRGNRVRHDNPCEIEIGDVVSVECDMLLKRYGIWTGEKFILYGKDRWGKHSVHEETIGNFMRGAEHFAICRFPKKYGRPTEWSQLIRTDSIVMPQKDIVELLNILRKTEQYKLYPPGETVQRAKSKLGMGGYPTSEHFAVWCKTGIAESHELQSLQKVFNHFIVY